MEKSILRSLAGENRGGYAMLLMLLVVIVIGVVMWVGQSFSSSGDESFPWNQTDYLVKRGEKIEVSSEQPQLGKNLFYKAQIQKDGKKQ